QENLEEQRFQRQQRDRVRQRLRRERQRNDRDQNPAQGGKERRHQRRLSFGPQQVWGQRRLEVGRQRRRGSRVVLRTGQVVRQRHQGGHRHGQGWSLSLRAEEWRGRRYLGGDQVLRLWRQRQGELGDSGRGLRRKAACQLRCGSGQRRDLHQVPGRQPGLPLQVAHVDGPLRVRRTRTYGTKGLARGGPFR